MFYKKKIHNVCVIVFVIDDGGPGDTVVGGGLG